MCEKCKDLLAPKSNKQFACSDCGCDTSQAGLREYYMINKKVWSSVADSNEMLCILCLERRLGRMVKSEEFEGFPINYMPLWNTQSRRLASRINGKDYSPADLRRYAHAS